MTTRLALLLCIGATILSACNAPPMYHARAEAFLKGKGVDSTTIMKLVESGPLPEQDIERLARFDDVPTLHLIGSHPSTPVPLLSQLAQHRNEEVRWGAATNRNTPLELLLKLRRKGEYATMHEYLARNPALPHEVIREMIQGKEAQLVSVAMNPNAPPDLMRQIAEHGQDLEKTWLAWNQGIPPEIMARLEQDASPSVANNLRNNPAYKTWRASQKGAP